MSNKNRVFKIMAALFVLLIIIIPLLINEAYKRDKGYITVGGSADVLSYYGAVLSAIGTTVLGVIAWKQNTRLVEIEERSFLSDNIGAIWIEAVENCIELVRLFRIIPHNHCHIEPWRCPWQGAARV